VPIRGHAGAVEDGAPDQPVEIWHGGKLCLTVGSLFRGACVTVQEEPQARFTPYAPHPRATIGPRVAALLAADRDRRARVREAAKTAAQKRGR
jgi:hypothetical protein